MQVWKRSPSRLPQCFRSKESRNNFSVNNVLFKVTGILGKKKIRVLLLVFEPKNLRLLVRMIYN